MTSSSSLLSTFSDVSVSGTSLVVMRPFQGVVCGVGGRGVSVLSCFNIEKNGCDVL